VKGHLVIADISGYTQFLTDSELDHANGIVGDLLTSITSAIRAPLTVSSIEGDAVFMYGSTPEGMSGQTIVESVELLYIAFARALETMVINTTCQCNACINIASLGLKIVMHCGEYMLTQVAGITSLSGPDVIMVHRLLKNHIIEETGIADYFLITQQCVDELGIESLAASWTPHSEEYEHVGAIDGYVASLADVWQFEKLQTQVKVGPDEAWDTVKGHTAAPPAIVWDHLIDPAKRVHWIAPAYGMDVTEMESGRVVPGTQFHCAHGDDDRAVFTILDMRSQQYCTIMVDFEQNSLVTYTWYLLPSGSGTRLVMYARAPEDAKGQPMAEVGTEDYRNGWHEFVAGNLALLVGMTDAVAAQFVGAGS